MTLKNTNAMKNTLNKLLLLTLVLVMSACTLDEDLDPLDPGDDRDKFTGSWIFSETIIRSTSYQVTISNDPSNSSQVRLSNLGNIGGSAYGIVTSSRITVPSQEVSGMVLEGSGTLTSENEMEWEYTVTADGNQDVCTAVATK